jgi:hypothetical protein
VEAIAKQAILDVRKLKDFERGEARLTPSEKGRLACVLRTEVADRVQAIEELLDATPVGA